jgi:hypothetical protein
MVLIGGLTLPFPPLYPAWFEALGITIAARAARGRDQRNLDIHSGYGPMNDRAFAGPAASTESAPPIPQRKQAVHSSGRANIILLRRTLPPSKQAGILAVSKFSLLRPEATSGKRHGDDMGILTRGCLTSAHR